MASWNVVSIYSACGSDFPDLHRSIVILKSVLQDFDEAFGKRIDRVTPKYRHDFCGHTQGDENGGGNGNCTPDEHRHDGRTRLISHAPVSNENAEGIVDQVESSNIDQHIFKQKDIATPNDGTEQTSDEEKPNMSSPFQPPHSTNPSGKKEQEIAQDLAQAPHTNPHPFSIPSPFNTAKFLSRRCLNTRSATPNVSLQKFGVPEYSREDFNHRASLPANSPARSTSAPRQSTSSTAPVANMVPSGEKRKG